MTEPHKAPRDAACSFVAHEATKHIEAATGGDGTAGDDAYDAVYAALRASQDDDQLYEACTALDLADRFAAAYKDTQANGPHWVQMDIVNGTAWWDEQQLARDIAEQDAVAEDARNYA